MKWQNSARDFLPATSRSVLISHHGVYHIAFFDKEQKMFQVSEGIVYNQVPPDDGLYWTDIDVLSVQNRYSNVLIVEDDHEDQKLLRQELHNCVPTLHLHSVYNGEQALNYLLGKGEYSPRPVKPDLIILDLNLPLFDGFELMREINRHHELADIPIYVVSTSRNADQWNMALNLGARCFFHKGSSVSDFRRVAQEICLSL